MTPSRYHPLLIVLHWLLAALVVFSLGMGTFVLSGIPNDSPDKLVALRGHSIFGVLILVLTAVRLAVRAFTQKPAAASVGRPGLDRLAALNHYVLYLLVVLMAASGIALAVQAGLPAALLGTGGATLPETFAGYLPRTVHGMLGTVLLALAGLHVLAALYHQLVRKDRLLARMGLGRRLGAS